MAYKLGRKAGKRYFHFSTHLSNCLLLCILQLAPKSPGVRLLGAPEELQTNYTFQIAQWICLTLENIFFSKAPNPPVLDCWAPLRDCQLAEDWSRIWLAPIPTTPLFFKQIYLQFGQIHFAIWTNIFYNLENTVCRGLNQNLAYTSYPSHPHNTSLFLNYQNLTKDAPWTFYMETWQFDYW